MRIVGVAVGVGSTVVVASVCELSLHAAMTATGSMARPTTIGDHLENRNIAHSL